jgi:lysophospholipase L1-like esterase
MNSDEETARGIAATVDAIISRKPNMKILLLGILPRSDEEMTNRVDNVNQMISILDNENSIRFLNLRNSFYFGNGTFATELYNSDLLHLSPEGYAKWGETMDPLFQEMLKM